MINSLVVILIAVVAKIAMTFMNEKPWAYELIRYTGAALPILLIILGVIENDGISIIFAGICFFGFPIMSRRPKNGAAT